MRIACAVLGLAALASAVSPRMRTSRHHRFSVAEEKAELSEQMELLAQVTGMNLVNGHLSVSTSAELREAEQYMMERRGWFSDWFDNVGDALSEAWTTVKEKFKGVEKDMAEAIDTGLAVGNYNAEQGKLVYKSVTSTRDKLSKPAQLLKDLIATLMSAEANRAIVNFCKVAQCVVLPSYKACVDVFPFSEMRDLINKKTEEKSKANKGWTQDLKIFALKATLRFIIHTVTILVKAGKMALDALPAGDKLTGFLEGIQEVCSVVAGGSQYGGKCIQGKIGGILVIIKNTINLFMQGDFKKLLSMYALEDAFPKFGGGDMVECVIGEAANDAVAALGCDASCKAETAAYYGTAAEVGKAPPAVLPMNFF